MPDILVDLDRFKEKMNCSEDNHCEYDEDGYRFIQYKDGVIELVPIRTEKSRYAPKYLSRPYKDIDNFFARHLPVSKQHIKLKWAIIIVILLTLIVMWYFIIYEIYYWWNDMPNFISWFFIGAFTLLRKKPIK